MRRACLGRRAAVAEPGFALVAGFCVDLFSVTMRAIPSLLRRANLNVL